MQLVYSKDFLKDSTTNSDYLRTKNLLKILMLIHGGLALAHLAITALAQLYLLSYIFSFYIVLSAAVLFFISHDYQKVAKCTFIFGTSVLFAALSHYLGTYHQIHWTFIAIIITPNLLFSFKDKKELILSVLSQVIIVFLFLELQFNTRFSHFSLNSNQTDYIQYFTFAYLALYVAFQIFYLLYLVNKNEESLRLATTQLIQSAKMSSLGEMAGGVAHEINTPISIIHMRAEQLIEEIQNNAKELDRESLLKCALSIDKTNKRITKIVNSLRTFSRNSSTDEKTVSLVDDIIKDTLDLCHENLKNVGIDVQYSSNENYYIKCKPSEISQVLLNLLNNSVDAIRNLKNRWIKIEVNNVAEMIEISVTDSGGGVPENVRDKIFQPFFTTKEIGKGTGLGLSLSKGIAQSHGGDLKLIVENDNTRFAITIPAVSL